MKIDRPERLLIPEVVRGGCLSDIDRLNYALRSSNEIVLTMTLRRSPVQSNPALLGGALVFRSSRVPAQTLLDSLDDGYTLDEFLELFPSVNRGDAEDFLRLAQGRDDANRP